MFLEIPEGITVRAVLKHEDLVLMGKVFVRRWNCGGRRGLDLNQRPRRVSQGDNAM